MKCAFCRDYVTQTELRGQDPRTTPFPIHIDETYKPTSGLPVFCGGSNQPLSLHRELANIDAFFACCPKDGA